MRDLVLKMSVSLDGFACGPNGEIDWIFDRPDRGVIDWTVERLWNAGVHIMGSRTFQDMAAHWPASTSPFAAPMNEIPKLVFSRRGAVAVRADLTTRALRDAQAASQGEVAPASQAVEARRAEWAASSVASGELAGEIEKLKAQDGKPVLAHGGVAFVQSLVATGLIDEYQLMVRPVLLGRGQSPFATLPQPQALTLVSTQAFPNGAVAQVYRRG
jgi:dihydrofolate reductase